MKVLFKNSNLTFQKFKLDRDVVIAGKMTESVHSGQDVVLTLKKGLYLVTLPKREDISLVHYESSYVYSLYFVNGGIIASTTGASNQYFRDCCIINCTEDNQEFGFFARADLGTNVTFHIKEITLPDVNTWGIFYSNTFNVTAGTGLYNFLLNNGHNFKHSHIYAAIISDTTKMDNIQWYLGDDATKTYNDLSKQPYFSVGQTDDVSENKTQVTGGDVVGTGSVTLTIYEYDASDII